jgi:hypothetical protein
MSQWAPGLVLRKLTANRSIAPGVWPWPPATNELVLHRGTNAVNIEVVSVEPPLVGETVELWIDPAPRFKAKMPIAGWPWFWVFWPIVLVILLTIVPLVIKVLRAIWATALRVAVWRGRRRKRQGTGNVPKSRPEAVSTVGEIISDWWAASPRNRWK